MNAATLYAIAPRFSGRTRDRQAEIIDAIAPVLDETLARYAITTPLRQAHFLAQLCHESAGFRTTEEFADGSDYEGRRDLGNTVPGDGKRFKGRGLIQLTGRFNYLRYGEKLGVDLLSNPEKAADPKLSLEIACLYWQDKGLNAWADQDNAERITRLINGGLNGHADRLRYLAKAKAALRDAPARDWDALEGWGFPPDLDVWSAPARPVEPRNAPAAPVTAPEPKAAPRPALTLWQRIKRWWRRL